jgi:hypothetical protein
MKKTAQNDVTGDWLQSKPNNEQFEKNFDLIFRKEEKKEPPHLNVEDHIIAVIPPTIPAHLQYEYELDKSTGEVIKKDTNNG